MSSLDVKGVFLQYEEKQAKTQEGVEFTKHVFTMKIPDGVTDIEVSNEEYIESLLKQKNVADIPAFIELVKKEPVDLYFVNSAKFIGYSFTEGFKKNHFPNRMGQLVEILTVDATPSGITLELADGTVSRRSFSKQIGGTDGQWYPDPLKRLRFIKRELEGITTDPINFDLNTLKGYRISYVIKKLGDSEFMDIVECKEPIASNSVEAMLADVMNGK